MNINLFAYIILYGMFGVREVVVFMLSFEAE